MTIDKGSSVSFLNWATAKQILESSKNTRFIPRENLNLTTKFVDYNKQPINILGATPRPSVQQGGRWWEHRF